MRPAEASYHLRIKSLKIVRELSLHPVVAKLLSKKDVYNLIDTMSIRPESEYAAIHESGCSYSFIIMLAILTNSKNKWYKNHIEFGGKTR